MPVVIILRQLSQHLRPEILRRERQPGVLSVQQLELLGDRAPLEVHERDKLILLATE
jgi:hypothetical protein